MDEIQLDASQNASAHSSDATAGAEYCRTGFSSFNECLDATQTTQLKQAWNASLLLPPHTQSHRQRIMVGGIADGNG
jgi:hypothetical protein